MNVERWRFHLRDYPKPCLNITDLFLWGKLVVAEQLADSKGEWCFCYFICVCVNKFNQFRRLVIDAIEHDSD